MPETIPPSWRNLIAQSFRVGCLGFGGPAGQIALMHRVFVDERKWIDDDTYQHALSFCTLLPGPEAQQLATYVGWRLRGAWGGVIAGWLFVLPGAAIMLALSALYVRYGSMPLIAALFDGIKCAVVALVAEALLRVGKRALKTRTALIIAVTAFVALMAGAPFPLVVLAAGAIGAVMLRQTVPSVAPVEVKRRSTLITSLIWIALWLAPVGLSAALLGPNHVLTQVGALFSVLACVTFGGAYALLAWLSGEAAARGWLTPSQMIDGLGLAETTPGPLVLVNQHVGFLAGFGEAGWGLALAAAAMATWTTFAPSFVWIFAGAPYAERLRADPRAAGALAAVTAAVLGVIATLALTFAAHALFAGFIQLTGGALPDLARPTLWAIALSATAALALIRFKAPLLAVLAACALGGAAAQALALP